MVENTFYQPIHVGKEKSSQTIGIPGDNSGDHISGKNENYCELTGMYWAWKNLKNIDYIGLSHYRRYFDFNKNSPFSNPEKIIHPNQFYEVRFDVPESVLKHLKQGQIILPKKESFRFTLYTDYCIWHYRKDLQVVENILKKKGDKSYIQAFDKVMYDNNELHPYNMFVMSWEEYEKYCTWLFSVLSEVENSIDIMDYDTYQKRIFGFLGERLLNVYVTANKLNVKTYPILFFSDVKKRKLPYFLNEVRRIANKLVSSYCGPKKENLA